MDGYLAPRERLSRVAAYLRGSNLGPVVIRSVAASSVVQVAAILAAFVVSIQLARGLGVEGYGEYGIAMAVITLAAIPAEFGVPKLVLREASAAAALKEWPKFFGVLRWADSTSLRISAMLAVAIAVGSAAILGSGKSSVVMAILFGVPIIPLLALAKIRGAALQALHFLVLGQIPQTLLRPVILSLLLLASYLVLRSPTAAEAMAFNSATALVALTLNHLWLRRREPHERPTSITRDGRRWLASSFRMALSDGMLQLQAQLSILMVGMLAGARDVGLFRIAISIVTFMVAPVVLLNVVVLPIYSRLYAEKDMGRVQRLCTRSTQVQFTAILIISLPLLLAGREILAFVFGQGYRGAYSPMAISFIGFLFSAACGANSELLNMTGHERRVTRAMSIGLVVNLVTMPILTSFFGLAGAALSLAAGTIAWNLIATTDAFRILHVNTTLAPIRSFQRLIRSISRWQWMN